MKKPTIFVTILIFRLAGNKKKDNNAGYLIPHSLYIYIYIYKLHNWMLKQYIYIYIIYFYFIKLLLI